MSTDAPPSRSLNHSSPRKITGRAAHDRLLAAAPDRSARIAVGLSSCSPSFTRIWLHRNSPLSGTHNYDRAYGASLSIMAGRGFNDTAVDESPASRPVQEFFDLKRSKISRAEFAAYLATTPDSGRDAYYGRFFSLASIRVADIRLAALLWEVFGINRGVLAAFYSIFSVVACGCVFLIGGKLTGSGWAGLAAAVPHEPIADRRFFEHLVVRDVSPMWFAAFAFAWFVCAVGCFRRPAANFATYAILGLLAVAGIGWRIDALLLCPFWAVALVRLIAAPGGWRYSLVAMACFAAAGFATRTIIGSFGAKQVQTENIGFHMAFYSDFPRLKLLGIENTFQVLFSDMQTLDNVGKSIGPSTLAKRCPICRPSTATFAVGWFSKS